MLRSIPHQPEAQHRMIQIVPFSPQHRAGVVDCILPIQQIEFGIPISLEARPDLADITAFYQRDNGNFWGSLAGNEVVGTMNPRKPDAQ